MTALEEYVRFLVATAPPPSLFVSEEPQGLNRHLQVRGTCGSEQPTETASGNSESGLGPREHGWRTAWVFGSAPGCHVSSCQALGFGVQE